VFRGILYIKNPRRNIAPLNACRNLRLHGIERVYSDPFCCSQFQGIQVLQEVSGMLRPTAMTAFCPLSKICRPKTLSLISGVSETLDGTANPPYTDVRQGLVGDLLRDANRIPRNSQEFS
jgi:hypothetical protein